jgi:hypothetical protein
MVLKFSGTLSKQSSTEDLMFAVTRKRDRGEENEARVMKQVPFLLHSESMENTSSIYDIGR